MTSDFVMSQTVPRLVGWTSSVQRRSVVGEPPTQPAPDPCGATSTPEGGSAGAPTRAPRRILGTAGGVAKVHTPDPPDPRYRTTSYDIDTPAGDEGNSF